MKRTEAAAYHARKVAGGRRCSSCGQPPAQVRRGLRVLCARCALTPGWRRARRVAWFFAAAVVLAVLLIGYAIQIGAV
jgi:hypothetical protein